MALKSADIKSPNLLSFRSYSSIFLPSRHRFKGIYVPKNDRNGRHQMPQLIATQRVFDKIFTVTEALRIVGNFSKFGRQPG